MTYAWRVRDMVANIDDVTAISYNCWLIVIIGLTLACYMWLPQSFYPINFMRNVAVSAAMTRYVYLVDVDMAPTITTINNLNILFDTRGLSPQEVRND